MDAEINTIVETFSTKLISPLNNISTNVTEFKQRMDDLETGYPKKTDVYAKKDDIIRLQGYMIGLRKT